MNTNQLYRYSNIPYYVHNQKLIKFFINYTMKDGKKTVAIKNFNSILNIIAKTTDKNPYMIFIETINYIRPLVELKTVYKSGVKRQMPVPIKNAKRANFLSINWLLNNASKRKETSFSERVANEIISTYNKQGNTIKKLKSEHKIALNARPFIRLNKRKLRQLKKN